MYPDAFSIERLASELNEWLKGCVLKDIFSTSKSDLYFVFSDKKGFKVQFFQGQAFFQFKGIETFPGKNRKSWFTSLTSQQLRSVNPHPYSRSFELVFDNRKKLIFKIFGKFSNVILFDETGKATEIFCLNFQKDLQIPLSFYTGKAIDLNFSDLSKRKETLDWLEKDALNFLEDTGYFISKNPDNPFNKFRDQYLNHEVNILKQAPDQFELSCFPKTNEIGSYARITDALNDFTPLYIGAESFKLKKLGQVSNLEKQINQKLKLQTELLNSLQMIREKRSYSEIADLIMANLHSIHMGTTKAEVLDFYQNTKVTLKLKPDLSPQQNAALYYQKAKNQVKEQEFKQKSLDEVTSVIAGLKKQLEILKSTDDAKTLRSLDKAKTGAIKEKQATLPYRPYKLGDFEILVGKNAKANDELLAKYTSKNDTWLHAKDVSGSHVIIRNPGNKVIPVYILEKAASLAAWYSKAKSNSLASVVYTLRKYVRKIKGETAGKVMVEREKSLLVKPENIA